MSISGAKYGGNEQSSLDVVQLPDDEPCAGGGDPGAGSASGTSLPKASWTRAVSVHDPEAVSHAPGRTATG